MSRTNKKPQNTCKERCLSDLRLREILPCYYVTSVAQAELNLKLSNCTGTQQQEN